jgi:putative colanic acid biosynthesis acetyltransferase WcaF
MNYQNLKLYKTPKNFRGRSSFVVQVWWFVQATLFSLSPQFMYGWRRFLLRMFGAKIGRKVILRPSVTVTYPWKLSIGDFSWVGDDVVLYTLGNINIGKNTVVSQKSYLCTGLHDCSKANFPIYSKEILIEDQCWVATDVYIAPGITIGKGAIVGARSSVFHNLEPGNIYVGSPAKFLKKRETSS